MTENDSLTHSFMTHDCRLGEDEMEVGLGLHGEPGAATHKMQCANDIAAQVGLALLQGMQHMTAVSYTSSARLHNSSCIA